ncbi:hypothetical protein L1987_23208 [Smallanthus sonchifolius]|uniref:Uncharacterized protein n=1 Tax=Smallanthus sonchifolius TaxID=185202 RepID=A0ACB9IJM8_9ASTR|nr:hypothetical protein L1987_23208 [Smallanthus sonchifolius]
MRLDGNSHPKNEEGTFIWPQCWDHESTVGAIETKFNTISLQEEPTVNFGNAESPDPETNDVNNLQDEPIVASQNIDNPSTEAQTGEEVHSNPVADGCHDGSDASEQAHPP